VKLPHGLWSNRGDISEAGSFIPNLQVAKVSQASSSKDSGNVTARGLLVKHVKCAGQKMPPLELSRATAAIVLHFTTD
jgi:hypothetical protein